MSIIADTTAPDPFSPTELAKLRLSQDFSTMSQVKQELTSVPCRKPHPQEFIQVRAGEENRFETPAFVDNESKDLYLVSQELHDQMARYLVPVMLVICLNRTSKVPFLWPVKLPLPERPNLWHTTGLQAAEMAQRQWIKLVSDMAMQCYVAHAAQGILEAPNWSEVPTIGEMMRLAFRDRLIQTTNHPILRRLRGEI